ncbi:MAG TPA: baseplate J/gp47 family protein, partial [Longimicrobium sp.]|nr:baseplate J/gp47 family protein [Longimicrobium sp.]
GSWRNAGRPVGRELGADPAALLVQPEEGGQLLSVFSATESQVLAEYRQGQDPGRTGVLRGGPERALVLDEPTIPQDEGAAPTVVLITAGRGSGQHRVIEARGAEGRVLRVDRAWDTLPNDASRYALVETVTRGTAAAATTTHIDLTATGGENARGGHLIWIDDDGDVGVRRLKGNRNPQTGLMEFEPAWPGLGAAPRYAVVATVRAGTALAAEDAELTLDLTGPGGKVREGQLVRIRSGTDEGIHRLTSTPGNDGRVTFAPPWPDLTGTPDYEVFEAAEEGSVSAETPRAVVLEDVAAGDDAAYQGQLLRIVEGTGRGRSGRIRTYSGDAQVAVLESDQADEVDSTSVYEIEGPADWLQYQNSAESDLQPELSWEYWNGRGWLRLTVDDTTGKLLSSGEVKFKLPAGMAQTEVAGQENFWIRVRLVGGDYGRETFLSVPGNAAGTDAGALQSRRDNIVPPVVHSLTIHYRLDEDLLPQHCITHNNLAFLDETAACQTDGKHFEPFQPLEDSRPALYLGFDRPLEGGPVRILFAADERDAEGANRPRMTWSFRTDNAWRALPADDRSEGLVRQGLLSLQLPKGFQQRSQFGRSLFWLRGSVDEGEYRAGQEPVLRGVFPNTVDAVQAATVLDENLGSSDGEPGQELRFLTAPPGDPRPDWSLVGTPEIRVWEVLSAEERAALEAELGPGGVATRTVLGEEQTWVLWTDVDTFVHSTPGSRHYRLDPARGRVRFGDGRRGMIPPAGTDNLRAFTYQAGGGAAGNVGAGEIQTLVTAVAGVDSVRNPVPAGGGGDVATVDQMLRQGAARISHRGRAVAPGDFEWHAREASGEVVKARCAAAADARGHGRAGWVTVYIVPRSTDDRPAPSLELRRAVERHLRGVGELGLSAAGPYDV